MVRTSVLVTGFLLVVAACKSEEKSFSGDTDTGTKGSAVEPTSSSRDSLEGADDGGFLPDTPVVGTGGVLGLDPIPPQKVNAGETRRAYSETLRTKFPVTGGEGNITFKVESKLSQTGTTAGTFQYRPGFTDTGGKYQNEVGKHTVKVTASDESGQTASTTFEVEVKPIRWNSVSRADASSDTDMVTDFHVFESLHPTRHYEQGPTIDGQKLNVKNCTALDDSSSITLIEDPLVAYQTSKENAGEFDSHLTLTFKYSRADQKARMDHMAFVTWLNFTPTPDTSISSDVPAKPIVVYFAYARCLDGLSPADCKKTTAQDGINHYFYCSDYMPAGMTKKDIYCGIARLNGIAGAGC